MCESHRINSHLYVDSEEFHSLKKKCIHVLLITGRLIKIEPFNVKYLVESPDNEYGN